jgi:hypothetical protein
MMPVISMDVKDLFNDYQWPPYLNAGVAYLATFLDYIIHVFSNVSVVRRYKM